MSFKVKKQNLEVNRIKHMPPEENDQNDKQAIEEWKCGNAFVVPKSKINKSIDACNIKQPYSFWFQWKYRFHDGTALNVIGILTDMISKVDNALKTEENLWLGNLENVYVLCTYTKSTPGKQKMQNVKEKLKDVSWVVLNNDDATNYLIPLARRRFMIEQYIESKTHEL